MKHLKKVVCECCGKVYSSGLSYFGENDINMVCSAKCAFILRGGQDDKNN